MRARTWSIFILVNIVVSAVVVLTVLFIWDRAHSPAPVPVPSIPTAATAFPATGEATPPPTVLLATLSPTPSGPLYYTVQEGDTLVDVARMYGVSIEDLIAANGLTDPNVLHVGQTLIIPVDSSAASSTDSSVAASPEPSAAAEWFPTPLPTLTPSGPPLVEIGQVLGSGDLANEVVVVRNRGGPASLEGWTLSDTEGHQFVFPALTLFTDAQVRVHSIAGNPTPSDLYWGRTAPAWSGGELATLRDAMGNVVDTYIVP